jgi:hypothetical protein
MTDNVATVLLPSLAGKELCCWAMRATRKFRYEQFAKQHRLTPQETKVLPGIIDGFALKEMSVMQKTYCKRQKHLVRLFFMGVRVSSSGKIF